MAAKTRRPAFRMTEEQEQLLTRAADLTGVNLSDFVVRASLRQAHQVMADQCHFTLQEEDWDRFSALSDAPMRELSPGLARLAARPSVFE